MKNGRNIFFSCVSHVFSETQWCRLLSGLVALGHLLLVGCATQKQEAPIHGPAVTLGWPEPPQDPRILYVKSLHQPADAGVKTSVFVRFGRWLSSSQEEQSLSKPFGIALDQKQNLCLTDTGANAVCFYDRQKSLWRRW